MTFHVVIPARYASTRLPGKPLLKLDQYSLIEHVVQRAQESGADSVIVATDDERICQHLAESSCEVMMTSPDHQSGSERLAEVVERKDFAEDAIIVNVQGDEPLIPARLIEAVAHVLANDADCVMSTAASVITDEDDLADPNVVKVVLDNSDRALYFSRAPIPYSVNRSDSINSHAALHHIGIYAYRAGFLRQFPHLPQSPLEQIERLEQLRVLSAGLKIAVTTIDYFAGIGVDTKIDLARVREWLQSH